MQAQLDLLKTEISILRTELGAVREEVALLRRLFTQQTTREQSPRESLAGFSLISLGVEEPPEYSSAEPPVSVETAVDTSECHLTWVQRERIAAQAGLFLAGALRGEIYGTSGRERIPLKSRFWIVARNYSGEDYNPPRVFRRWNLAKPLVKRADHLGRSVLVGLPSERECRCALRAAGLPWPDSIEG